VADVRFPELPRDPDLDDLPPELAAHDRPLFIEAVFDGERVRAPITREQLAAVFAARRRREEDA
jgi:hypothetical protein